MVAPSWAVTSTVMALGPTSSAIALLALPLVTVVRLDPLPTFTVASGSFTVGMSFTYFTVFSTVAMYLSVDEAKSPMSSGLNVPSALGLLLAFSADSLASVAGRVVPLPVR